MEQLNRIELRGIVGFTRLQIFNGKKVLHFNLATNYVYKDKDGSPVIETSWHNVSVWEGKNIPELEKVTKGTKLQLTGRLRSQRYTDEEGVEKSFYEILANRMAIIDENTTMTYESYSL